MVVVVIKSTVLLVNNITKGGRIMGDFITKICRNIVNGKDCHDRSNGCHPIPWPPRPRP